MQRKFIKSLLAISLAFAGFANAEVLSANGSVSEISIKANGDLVNARRIARDQAEKDAVSSLLKIKLSANVSDPKIKDALPELRKQLTENFKTTFIAEGDFLTAKSTLQVDSSQFFDLAKSLGITSKASSASAKVLFLIDEYFGVGTKLDPSKPLVSEMEYSHDKSSFSDKSSSASGASSSSRSDASAEKSSFAASGSEKAAFAGSSSTAVAGRDRQAISGSDQRAIAVQDGAGGSAAGARSTQISGARDTQIAASNKTSVAGSASSDFAAAGASQSSKSSSSSDASNFNLQKNDVNKQNDIVNMKIKQVFPGIDNAKPADDTSALINQKLQQVVKEFGLVYTDEKDFRVEGGRKLTINEINRLQKFDAYLQKASQGNYKAKYLVYGTAVMQSEGQSASGQVRCAGQLALTSSDVDTGEGFVSGTIGKQAIGSSDQTCRTNLSEALARQLADYIGTAAQKDLQQANTQGRTYTLAIYSALRLPSKLRREFSAKVKALDGVVEIIDDGNASEEMRRYTVVAKGNFSEKIDDVIDDIVEADNSAYKSARFEKKGNRMIFCVEGKCPKEY